MEVLSCLFERVAKNPSLTFHRRCRKMMLTHPRFACDLMVFSHVDGASLRLLIEAIDTFQGFFALKLNLFVDGKLLIKYLGLPLLLTRIYVSDCKPLVDKILGSITSWMSKFLSFARRLTLINSIFNIQVFWSSFFIFLGKILELLRLVWRLSFGQEWIWLRPKSK